MAASSRRLLSLDVMRTLAIVLVMFRHRPPQIALGDGWLRWLNVTLHRGGWVGVDLFFVLSGFLVSGLLFHEYKKHGRLDLKRFLVRRGFKIYPAFYAFLGISVAYWTWVKPNPKFTTERLLAEIFYVQNFFPRLWDHTWSLAVEEHFYLGLALVLGLWGLAAGRVKKGSLFQDLSWIPRLCFAVCVACFVARFSLAYVPEFRVKPTLKALYYPTHLRMDNFAFGMGLSYMYHFHAETLRAFVAPRRWAFVFFGLVLLMPPFFVNIRGPFMMSFGFAHAYLGSGMMLAGLLYMNVTQRNYLVRAIAYVGFFSYSIYLVHLPVMKWLFPLVVTSGKVSWAVGMPLFVAMSCVVGIVFAKVIEMPMLKVRDAMFPSQGSALGTESTKDDAKEA